MGQVHDLAGRAFRLRNHFRTVPVQTLMRLEFVLVQQFDPTVGADRHVEIEI